ncbi:MAG: hypothetical protein HQ536_02095 [Parcubacteria group bacterium]|nr:hypothetical protein [Parcubacteria group bacterium]
MILFLDKLDILKKISKKGRESFQGIVVVFDKDTFSSLRSKVAVANTLSFAWGIPVVGVKHDEFADRKELLRVSLKKLKKTKVGKFLLPTYDKEPNIT